MKDYILAKNVLDYKHIGSLVNIKEVLYSKTGKVICREYDNCIVTNLYKGLLFRCCILLNNTEYLIYDLDNENIDLYITFMNILEANDEQQI